MDFRNTPVDSSDLGFITEQGYSKICHYTIGRETAVLDALVKSPLQQITTGQVWV